MAIFNNSDSSSSSANKDSNTTIITAGTKIKGEINLSCNLYMDGEVEGSIHSSKEVSIGKNGCVKGSLFVEKLIVQGYVEGSIDSERVEIKAAGRVSGEITSNELIIESKGVFEGSSIVKELQKAAAVTPKEITKL